MPHTIRLHRILRSTPERVYRAFLDPDALVKWNPLNGFTGKVHHLDARVGGAFKMSFTNFATGHSHAFGGQYVELIPSQRIRSMETFEDANLPGPLQLTIDLTQVSCGTELRIVQDKKGFPMLSRPKPAALGGRSRSNCWRNSCRRRFQDRAPGDLESAPVGACHQRPALLNHNAWPLSSYINRPC